MAAASFPKTSRKCRGCRLRKSSKWGDTIHHHNINVDNNRKMDASLLSAIPAGFRKVSSVFRISKGKWRAFFYNPITKATEWIGAYNTPEEAEEAYANKKLEFEAVHNGLGIGRKQTNGLGIGRTQTGIWYSPNTGKWGATIRNPVTKVLVWIGTFDTIEEAKNACKSNKTEKKQSGEYQRKQGFVGEMQVFKKAVGITLRKSGTWTATIQHPITNTLLYLGTYDTPQEAEDAHKVKKLEFESMFPAQRKWNRNAKSLWYAVYQDPVTKCSNYLGMYRSADEAAEALRKKKESELVVNGDDDIEHEAVVVDGENDIEHEAVVVNGDDDIEHEAVVVDGDDSMEANMDDDDQDVQIGMFEESEVVNAYGELIGEFSRIDDELWLV